IATPPFVIGPAAIWSPRGGLLSTSVSAAISTGAQRAAPVVASTSSATVPSGSLGTGYLNSGASERVTRPGVSGRPAERSQASVQSPARPAPSRRSPTVKASGGNVTVKSAAETSFGCPASPVLARKVIGTVTMEPLTILVESQLVPIASSGPAATTFVASDRS